MKTRLIAIGLVLTILLSSGCVAMMAPMIGGMFGMMDGSNGGDGGHGKTTGSESKPRDAGNAPASPSRSGQHGANQESEAGMQQGHDETGHAHGAGQPRGDNE
ncbi:MAG: hypothetical protein AB1512_04485 [Thermodesulfobacteriota bacterium]